jgi:hypothetical protein
MRAYEKTRLIRNRFAFQGFYSEAASPKRRCSQRDLNTFTHP